MNSICLAMIVKDEAHVIERCLKSVIPYIDAFAICDTGSSDNTLDIASDILSRLPGKITKDNWQDFSTNRNKSLELARKQNCDYILLIDADETLKINNPRKQFFSDGYYVKINFGITTFYRAQLIKSSADWRYWGVVHEYLACSKKKTIVQDTIDDIEINSYGDSNRNKLGDKHLRDIELLLNGLKEEPKNARYTFYLAESYKFTRQFDKAIEWYKERFLIQDFFPERFLSILYIARILEAQGEEVEAVQYYLKASMLWNRPEPLYSLARIHYNNGDKKLHRLFSKKAYEASIQKPTVWTMFVEQDIWDWRASDDYAFTLFEQGKYSEALKLYKQVLKQVPYTEEERVNEAIQICLDKLEPSSVAI